ncbi:Dyp-type peroxidase [Dactylosporangium sucinum]|uniref:Iron-dependent peroxidase n=1 Tax=Dactylosporangium sucinum TaxID=1424081 RepID=A0A917UAQ4_9ACTN|nr:Dyp-type peroxidase [Dactylosporangium sucinum]GGM67111.1 iron-dependent peroxidase [Dactylosporangium sucinum]
MDPALNGRGMSRRLVLAGTGLLGGSLLGATGCSDAPSRAFYGVHQSGITTPVLPFLQIAGFDVVARDRDGLIELLQTWTRVAAELASRPSAALSLTFGFGPALFAEGRFGLAARRPPALTELPSFPGDSLDPAAGGGDLCIQICAQHPTTAHDAVRALVNAGRSNARLRWRQVGFRDGDDGADPTGLFGFRDGTASLDLTSQQEQVDHLWVSDGPAWLHGGTYLVVRRIRLLLDTWDRTDIATQETIIGRRRDSNDRLGGVPTAHVQLASPEANGGAKLLRRSYSYDAGTDPNGLMDAGLIFICFQRDPQRQFVAIQQRLGSSDPLNGYSQHLASGVFACPAGVERGSWIGASLLS